MVRRPSQIPCLPLRPTDNVRYRRADHPQPGSGFPERATRTCLGFIGDSPGLFALPSPRPRSLTPADILPVPGQWSLHQNDRLRIKKERATWVYRTKQNPLVLAISFVPYSTSNKIIS